MNLIKFCISLVALLASAAWACNTPVNYSCQSSTTDDPASRATVGLVFTRTDGTFTCTGTLLNDEPADGKGYILSAAHCAAFNPSAVSLIQVYWHSISACSTGLQPFTDDATAMTTATIVTMSNDQMLLVSSSVPAGVYFSGSDGRNQNPSTGVFSIQHSSGETQQLTADPNPPTMTTTGESKPDGTVLYFSSFNVPSPMTGTTAAGASGSGLFTQAAEPMLIGTDSTADTCGSDYSALAQNWSSFQPWLDPQDTSGMVIDGMEGPAASAPQPSPTPTAPVAPAVPVEHPAASGSGGSGSPLVLVGLLAAAAARRWRQQ